MFLSLAAWYAHPSAVALVASRHIDTVVKSGIVLLHQSPTIAKVPKARKPVYLLAVRSYVIA
jgi:hypothetical protein